MYMYVCMYMSAPENSGRHTDQKHKLLQQNRRQ